MNLQEYISSGIVESYVLGLADEAERVEFERMCLLHSEVRDARDAFEAQLEEQALSSNIQPPVALKSKILSVLEMERANVQPSGRDGSGTIPPVVTMHDDGAGSRPEIGNMRVRRFPVSIQKLIAVAAVILLVLSTILNIYFFSRYQEFNEKYQALLASQSDLAKHNQLLQTRMLDYERSMDMMKDPGMAIVRMPAIETSPDPTSSTVVYWDTASKDVYLAVSKLPAPSADHQYQLWAMVDGKPVDAGVFDLNAGATMIKMKNIPRAQAFAITLEKKGGSPTPTMNQLYVMGKV